MGRWLVTIGLWVSLLLLPFATLAAVDGLHGPSDPALAEVCTRYCHDHGCPHHAEDIDWGSPALRVARQAYLTNLAWLRAPAMGYRHTNLAVYVVGAPSVFAGLLLIALWPRAGARAPVVACGVATSALAILLSVVVATRATLLRWDDSSVAAALYWLCTDFCIHAANALGLSYETFNFLLFLCAFPLTGVGLLVAAGWRIVRR